MPKYTCPLTDRTPFGIRSRTDLLPNTGEIIDALGDASDATWGRHSVATLPADYRTARADAGLMERIVSVCQWARAKMPGTKTVSLTLGLLDLEPEPPAQECMIHEDNVLALTPNATIANYEVAAHQGQLLRPLLDDEWTISEGKVPMLAFRDPHTADANKAYWYEAGVYCYTLKPATATATGPTGTVTTTQRPTLAATIGAVVESWQLPAGAESFYTDVEVQWRVYLADDVGPGPPVEPGEALPVWSSIRTETIDTYIDGSTPTEEEVAATCGTLVNEDYVLYVRASRKHPANTRAWSISSHTEFTINIVPPTAPALTVTKSDGEQRIRVQAQAYATEGYDSDTAEVEVQRQVDDLWRAVRGMTDVPLAVGSLVTIGDDYECERTVTNYYRARVSMELSADETRNWSAWTYENVSGPAVTGWNLKALEDPELNWIGVPVLVEPSEASQRQSAIFAPLHRSRPVVTSGIVAGLSGSLEILAKDVDGVAALEALEDYSGLMLMETAFGDAKYIRPTAWAWTRQGTASAPRRTASCEYTEVGSDLEVEE